MTVQVLILTITVNGDTNNYLIDIDGNGDVNGHTLIHSHTGGIADVDITQSGVNDNMITLTTSGDNADIDIITNRSNDTYIYYITGLTIYACYKFYNWVHTLNPYDFSNK